MTKYDKSRYPLVVAVALALLVSLGCGSRQTLNHAAGESGANARHSAHQSNAKSKITKPALPPEPPLDSLAYEYFVSGLLYSGINDVVNASRSFGKAFRRFPESREIGYSLAETLFRLRKSDSALSILNQINPHDVPIFRLLARCYHELGQMDSVRSMYLHLSEAEPGDSHNYSVLSSLYRNKGDIDSTVWAYRKLIEVSSSNYRIYNDLGRILLAANRREEAREVYKSSLEADSSSANLGAVFALAELYTEADQFDSARVVYDQALRVEPDNKMIHHQLIAVLMQSDSVDQAIVHAQKVVDLSPLDKNAIRRLGVLYYVVDSLDRSDSILTMLVEDGDSHSTNYYYLGRIAALRKDWYKARDQFLILSEINDTSYLSWLDLAYAYQQLDEPELEIEAFQEGLGHMKRERDAINLYFGLGAAYERGKKYPEAEATFRDILEHNPDHDATLNFLGYMLVDRNEQLEYAEGLIARALEIQPENAAYLDSYGWAKYRLGEFDAALEYLIKAAEGTADPVVYDHLGDTYHAKGNADEATEWWQKAYDLDPENESYKKKLGL